MGKVISLSGRTYEDYLLEHLESLDNEQRNRIIEDLVVIQRSELGASFSILKTPDNLITVIGLLTIVSQYLIDAASSE